MNIKKYYILILWIFSIIIVWARPYVLMVSFDGFRHDYTDRCDTPNFDRLENGGVSARSLIPVFPSLTFPNHYSIATGSYASTHGLIANTFYDKKFKETYSLRDRETVENGKWYGAEPIWVTAEMQNVNTATYFWVGSEAEIKGYRPSIYKPYDERVLYEARIDSIFSWFALERGDRPQLAMLYFDEPDHAGHVSGPESRKVTRKIKTSDELLGMILEKMNTSAIKDSLDLIVVSDHGMTEVSVERIIYVKDHLRGLYDMKFFNDGPFMQIDVKPNKSPRKKSIYRALSNIPNVNVYEKDDIPEHFHFKNHNSGDFLMVADEGWFIFKDYKSLKAFTLKGMHGYDPQLESMHSIFYAYGPSFKDGMRIRSFENIHIYPLLCYLLNLEPYAGADGQLEVLQNIIK